jgi:hypothetical protein
MDAFSFKLLEETKLVSKNGTTCTYWEGSFKLDQCKTSVGNSLDNTGGIGGFVGPNHEYLLYCGSQYGEIAVLKKVENEWVDHACLLWDEYEEDSDLSFFENIWFTKKELTLIFEPKSHHKDHIMKELGYDEESVCIILDLSTKEFTGATCKEFEEQKHSTLNSDSVWPGDMSIHGNNQVNQLRFLKLNWINGLRRVMGLGLTPSFQNLHRFVKRRLR